jgi:hypothetical protein
MLSIYIFTISCASEVQAQATARTILAVPSLSDLSGHSI